MGGVAGHMAHLSEDTDLTFNEIISILSKVANAEIDNATEKVDGQNLFLTVDDSGEIKNVADNCFATVGTVSNLENKNIKIGSAGRKRWLGFRPKVRGVAMNPIDHPHGGGEGRTSGGRHPSTPWGKPTKGYKTRKNKKTDKSIVRSRRSK